jgi:hypothetical protein
MSLFFWRLAALLIAALSLAPSYAHMLEAPPRLTRWSPELWREATVFGGQFQYFAAIGGPIDVAAILVTAVAAYLVRHQRPVFWFALAGAVLYAVSMVCFLAIVQPANAELATWTPGPVPDNFFAVRKRWETGHIIITIVELFGFLAVALSVLWPPRRGAP